MEVADKGAVIRMFKSSFGCYSAADGFVCALPSPFIRPQRFLGGEKHPLPGSVVAAMLFERVINQKRVVPHKTIRAICANMAAAEESFHIAYCRQSAS